MLKTVAILISTLLLSGASLRFTQNPFLWIGPIWVLAGILGALMARTGTGRAIWINATAVVAALGVAEFYFWMESRGGPPPEKASPFREEGTITQGYYVDSPFLGYALPPDRVVTERKYYGDELLFDAVYSTDSRGLRVTSRDGADPAEPCVLFFGDSFTFGYGVNDTETLPYRVAIKTGRRTLNFGVGGYGTHQMLSALEHGIVEKAVDCAPKVAIYQGLMDHVARAAGKRFWDTNGPRYVLTPDGAVRFAGRFSDTPDPAAKDPSVLEKSHLFRRFAADNSAIKDDDVHRFLAIVAASRDRLRTLYPQASFHIIFWGTGQEAVLEGIRDLGISLHPIDRVIPDYEENRSRYEISPHEKHPSPLGHERIADYIATRILD